MAWSKVKTKFPKPLGWWYHKVMCEIGWALRGLLNSYGMYFRHMRVLDEKYGINLYGQPLGSDYEVRQITWLYRVIGFDYHWSQKFGLKIWLLGRVISVKNSRKHELWFSERNGYSGKHFGRFFISIKKPFKLDA